MLFVSQERSCIQAALEGKTKGVGRLYLGLGLAKEKAEEMLFLNGIKRRGASLASTESGSSCMSLAL